MPQFGHAMLSEWKLSPDITYLNHGTVGATPRKVLDAQQLLRDRMESDPAKFMFREYTFQHGRPLHPKSLIRQAADDVARFLGANGDDLVFVDNATTGINAILQSLDFQPDDEIVLLDHAYGSIAYTAQYVGRLTKAKVRIITLPIPITDPGQVVRAVEQGIGPKTRLALIDHITSESALLMPIAEIASVCRRHAVPILIDGAHAPGAIDLDISSLGVDWYVGNLHKWAFAPRGCGILWADKKHQGSIHSPVISWGFDKGMTEEFDWVGTKDPTNFLSAPAGIEFIRSLGAAEMRQYNHSVAWEGANRLCKRFGTSLTTPKEMIGTMATLPLPLSFGSTKADAFALRDQMLFEEKIEAQIHGWNGQLWMRISGQVYLEMTDIERFGDAIEKRMR
ncbi:MAG: aminotransferase class V-fold PLP-dependent enzyme [bacterium]|nr:aminotransferase class V-fold PLP-dependent enzyme [bacterium]